MRCATTKAAIMRKEITKAKTTYCYSDHKIKDAINGHRALRFEFLDEIDMSSTMHPPFSVTWKVSSGTFSRTSAQGGYHPPFALDIAQHSQPPRQGGLQSTLT